MRKKRLFGGTRNVPRHPRTDRVDRSRRADGDGGHHGRPASGEYRSAPRRRAEARRLGAHHVVNSRSDGDLDQVANRFDFIISTVNVSLDWDRYVAALAPKGRLHVVGAVLEPIPISAFSLIMGQKSLSGNPVGSPATNATMLDFCARHGIEAQTEHFPMSQVNDALDHLRSGKARYRVVLDRD